MDGAGVPAGPRPWPLLGSTVGHGAPSTVCSEDCALSCTVAVACTGADGEQRDQEACIRPSSSSPRRAGHTPSHTLPLLWGGLPRDSAPSICWFLKKKIQEFFFFFFILWKRYVLILENVRNKAIPPLGNKHGGHLV